MDFDPVRTENKAADDKAAETSAGDDDAKDTDPLLPPPPPPPKDPYFGSHTITRFDAQRSGLPKRGPKTAETSFIEGTSSGQVMTAGSLKIQTAHEMIQNEYPQYGKDLPYFLL